MAKELTIELDDNRIMRFKPNELVRVESSNVYKIGRGYITDPGKKEIPCVFVNFKKKITILYIYEGITIPTYEEWLQSSSKGEYLNKVIIPNAINTYKAMVSCLK